MTRKYTQQQMDGVCDLAILLAEDQKKHAGLVSLLERCLMALPPCYDGLISEVDEALAKARGGA